MTHKCPITDCTIDVPNEKLMCLRHWRLVPRDIQAQIYAAAREFNKKRDRETLAKLRVRQSEGIASVEAALEALEQHNAQGYRSK